MISEFFQYLILAIIQGILEWLPVSSEGFLILTAVNIFGMNWDIAFRVAIYFHLGTAFSVVIRYWRKYWAAILSDHSLLRFLLLSTLFTGVIGVPLLLFMDTVVDEFVQETVGLIITLGIGVLLIITATFLRLGKLKGSETKNQEERSVIDECLLGVCQGFAILPGISRSGTTSTFLILRGYSKQDAFNMSFFISLPAVLGAVVFELFKEIVIYENPDFFIFDWSYLLLLGITAVVGYFSMDFLLRIAQKYSFDKICYLLGGCTILLVMILLIFG